MAKNKSKSEYPRLHKPEIQNRVEDALSDFLWIRDVSKRHNTDYENAKQKLEKLLEEYAEETKQDLFEGITIELSRHNTKAISFPQDKITIKKIQPTKIYFDASKLSDCLPEKLRSKIIIKEYEIKDIAGFLEYIKELGGTKKQLVKFLNVKKYVNKLELDKAYDTGELKADDIDEKCYEVSQSKAYFTIKEGNKQSE